MKKKIGNIISGGLIVLFIIYVIFSVIRRNNIEKKLVNKGFFNTAIIVSEFIGKQSTRHFTYKYQVQKTLFKEELGVEVTYFNQHKIGDTIIIKFLPEEPDKNMIMEGMNYKTCYGLPPTEGWQKLPECE